MKYPTDDVVMICEMGLAVLAPVDLVGVKVNVVRQAHVGGRADEGVFSCSSRRILDTESDSQVVRWSYVAGIENRRERGLVDCRHAIALLCEKIL